MSAADTRHEQYQAVSSRLRALLENEDDWIAALATIACELHHSFEHFDWTGFYRVVAPELLVIGPYQGSHGCLRIPFSRGVCGAAARTRTTQRVDDVSARADHIACSSATRSELVVPVLSPAGEVLAVLDVDSNQRAAFDEHDQRELEAICRELGRRFPLGERGATHAAVSAPPSSADGLLAPDEPPPYRVSEAAGDSPFVITCDHAGRLLPRALGDLGLPPAELERHIAWDIGAAGVAEKLGRALGAFVICQTYSRLAIDCNRPLDSQSSIAKVSEATTIPGNQNVDAHEIERRAQAIFHPYHRRIEQELERRANAKLRTVYLAIHSFTPCYLGKARPWQLGVLYGKDGRFARAFLELARQEPGLVVGDNEPYFVSELSDYGVVQHAERRGHPYVEIEIRQDLIADEPSQSRWAELLARLVVRTAQARRD